MITKTFTFLTFLFTSALVGFTQITFQQAHSNSELNKLTAGASITTSLHDGGYMTALASSDSPNTNNLFLRLDAYGDTIWTKEFPITNIRIPRFIEQDNDSNIVVIGHYDVPVSNWSDEVYYMRIDTSGNLIDYDNLTSSGNSSWNYPTGNLAMANNGNYVVGIKTWTLSSDFSVLRGYDANFYVQWSATFGSRFNMTNFHQNDDNSWVMAGNGYPTIFSSNRVGRLYKVSEYGGYVFIQDYTFPGSEHSYFDDVVQIESGYAILGRYEDAIGEMHTWLVKTDQNGDTTLNVDFPLHKNYEYIRKTPTGDLLLFGTVQDSNGEENFTLSKMDTNFVFSAHYEYPFPGSNNLRSIDTTLDGGYVFSGVGNDTLLNDPGAYVLKIGPDYCLDYIPGINEFQHDITICSGDSLQIGTNYYSTAGVYTELLTSTYGCDSAVIVNLNFQAPQITNISVEICHNDSLAVGNTYLSTSGIHTVNLQSIYGCDSVVTVDLTVRPEPIASSQNYTECYGEAYTIGGNSYSTPGTYTDTVQNSYGCDSIVTTNLSFYPLDTVSVIDSFCQGDTYYFDSGFTTTEGSYTVFSTNEHGCDSLTFLTLTTIVDTGTIYQTICYEDSVYFGGQYFYQTGSYPYTGTNQSGCDSVRILELTVLPQDVNTQVASICYGDSILFGGVYRYQTGVYSSVSQNTIGCDSITNLYLTVQQQITSTISEAICSGDSILFGGTYYNQNGSYTSTFTSVNGCDSLVTMNLSVLADQPETISETICSGDSIQHGPVFYSQPGMYSHVFTNAFGCDSTVILNLSVANAVSSSISDTICAGDSIQFGPNYYNQAGSYSYVFNTVHGCDSTVFLDLAVNTITLDLGPDEIICLGDSVLLDAGTGNYNYAWNTGATSQTIFAKDSSMYSVQVFDGFGCSSIDSILVDTDDCASISVLENEIDIIIYPNPSTGKFFIKTDLNGLSIRVFDSKGRLVLEQIDLEETDYFELQLNGEYLIQFIVESRIVAEQNVVVVK